MRLLLYLLGLVLSFILGAAFAVNQTFAADAQTLVDRQKPVYLVASWNLLHPDQLKPFGDAAVPLAKRAGLEMLAATNPQVLEGDWPYEGIVIVQKYTSMQALLDFWHSPEHGAAKKLRQAHIDSHFVIAIEATE